MVAENFRYRPLYHRVKQLLYEGVIGQVFAANWQLFMYVHPETNKYAQTEWRIHHQYPGGFITDGGVHNIAVFRLLFSEIRTVSARAQSINPTIGQLDTLSLQFTTEQNVIGNFQLFFSANGHSENRLLIIGREGTLIIEDNQIILKKEGHSEKTEVVEDDGGYQAEFEDFYQAVRYGKPVLSTFGEAFRDLEVILAALKSVTAGKTVRLV